MYTRMIIKSLLLVIYILLLLYIPINHINYFINSLLS